MEKPKSTFPKQEKNKAVISIGKASGGGGIGVGIIFLGGAVASATAAFLIRRTLRKSSGTSNSKNCNHDRSTPSSEIPYKFLEDGNKNQSKGLQFVARDSSPSADTDQNLSNGTAKIGVHENDNTTISDQSFSLDQNYKVEANEGKRNPISDGEETIPSNSPKGLVSSIQFDASPIKEEKSALPLVENQTLHQLKNVADHLSGEEIEMIREDNSIDTALVDKGTEEKNQQMLENIEGQETESNCCPDEDNMKEFRCQEESEKTNEEQRRITKLQFGEEQESPFHCGKESDLCKDERHKTEESYLAFKTVEVIEKDEALDATDAEQDNGDTDTMTQMTEVHDSLCTESFGVINRNEKLEASHEDLGKGNTPIVMLAEEETKCYHHDISLNIGANEETKGNETFKASDEDEREGTVALMSEGQRKCLVGLLTTETADVMREFTMLEEDEGRDNEFVLVKEERGAQHDKEISGEGSKATGVKAQFPDNIASGSNKQKTQIEEPQTSLNVDHEDMSVCDEVTSEDSSCDNCSATMPNMPLTVVNIPAQLKPEIGSDNGFIEVQLSAEAAEARKENVASEPTTEVRVVESENPPMQLVERQQHLNGHNENQLEEVEDTCQLIYAANVTIGEHNLMRPEEDSLDDEGDDDADEANIIEKVEKSSEGTGDSSFESNTEPFWPAESLEEVSVELKELKIKEQKEEQMEEDQTVKTQVPMYLKNIENSIQKENGHKGNSKLTFLERVMLQLADQTHQPTYSQKLRILIPPLLVLSWSLCFWLFGLPILQISLIVILIKILSKIQGF